MMICDLIIYSNKLLCQNRVSWRTNQRSNKYINYNPLETQPHKHTLYIVNIVIGGQNNRLQLTESSLLIHGKEASEMILHIQHGSAFELKNKRFN